MENAGTLYIVATPIGNLGDMTLRAIETLKNVDIIACEDTRVTGKLLELFGFKKPLVSYFQHSALSKIEYIISELQSGKNIALTTDAGTPGISDPGQQLIAQIRRHSEFISESHGIPKQAQILKQVQDDTKVSVQDEKAGDLNDASIKIIPIPGVSALTAAASVSGMIEKEFYFAGFLPKKKGRQTKFRALNLLDCPVVIYESANRLERTLGDIKTYFGAGSEVFIAREITKMFEEYWGGSVDEVMAGLSTHQMKGEIVLVVKRQAIPKS